MRGAVFTGPGSVDLSEYAAEEPMPGWVRIGISAVGICGTDLHVLEASYNKGIRPGHEVAGIIDAVGEGVDFATGTPVTVEPLLGCGTCFSCGTGLSNRCADFQVFGVHKPGGLADYLNVPASLVYPVSASLSAGVTALTEPMAVVCRGIRRGGVRLGSKVAVIGCGSIGLLAILAARAAGAAEVHATARYPKQAELARLMGATAVYGSGEELQKAVGNQYIEVAVETVGGKADTVTEAVQVTRAGGTIVMLGIFDGSPAVPGFDFAVRELTMVGSSCYGRDIAGGDFGLAIQLVEHHRDVLPELISHRFSLDQVKEAFAMAGDKRAGAIKVQMLPGG